MSENDLIYEYAVDTNNLGLPFSKNYLYFIYILYVLYKKSSSRFNEYNQPR